MNTRQERLLKEYVRQSLSSRITPTRSLNEDLGFDAGLGLGGADWAGYAKLGVGPFMDPMFYTGGRDPNPLLKAFVEPFTDVFKTAVAGAKKITSDIGTLMRVVFEGAVSAIIPGISADYQAIFDRRDEKMAKLESEYADVFERTDAALQDDAKLLAFMANPAVFLAGSAALKAPAATKELLSVATGGATDDAFENAKAAWQKIERALLSGDITKKKAAARKESVYEDLIASIGGGGKSSKRESVNRSASRHLSEEKDAEGFDEFLRDVLKNDGVRQAISQKIKSNDRMKALYKSLSSIEADTLKEAEQSAQKFISQVGSFEGVKNLASKDPKIKQQIEKLNDPKAQKMLVDNVEKATKTVFISTLSTRLKMLPKGSEERKQYEQALAKVTKL